MTIDPLDHLGLVHRVVNGPGRRMLGRPSEYDRNDAEQDGYMGLLSAARTYDPTKGARFSTYATACILNEVRKGYGRALGLNYRHAARSGEFFSGDLRLEAPVGGDRTLLDVIADAEPVADDTASDGWLPGLLSSLSPRDRVVVTNPSRDAARLLGIKPASVQRRRVRIYARLREQVASEWLERLPIEAVA